METKRKVKFVFNKFRSLGFLYWRDGCNWCEWRPTFWLEKKGMFSISFSCSNFILVDANDVINGKWSLILVYGEPSHSNREKVWYQLNPWIAPGNIYPTLLIGDFNEVDSFQDKIGAKNTKIRGLKRFVEWKENHNLHDIVFSGPRFTWTNRRKGDDKIMERLDKAYANTPWLNIFPQAHIIHGPITISDHAPIILTTNTHGNKKKRNYKMEAWSMEYDQCVQEEKSSWNKEVKGSPIYKCTKKIKFCRETMKNWSLDKRKEWQGKWDKFEKDLIEAQYYSKTQK